MDEEVFRTVAEILARQGGDAWLVGGSLRDRLLGRPTRDFDFALARHARQAAEEAARRFRAALVVLEEEREIFRVCLADGLQLDFARFKGQDIEEDLARRDFTINAMAARLGPDGTVRDSDLLDPHGGRGDLRKKIVRQVSASAFDQDPLRMLRAFRFAARLGFSVDPATLESIRERAGRIREPAVERSREELLLLLDSPRAYPVVLELDRCGLISALFPEIDPNRACALHYYPGKGVWGHSLDGLDNLEWIFHHLESEFPEDAAAVAPILSGKGAETEGHSRAALMKLAVLLHDIGKAATAQTIEGRMRFFQHAEVGAKMTRAIARRFKFSSDAVQALSTLVLRHMRPGGIAHMPQVSDRTRFRFFRDLGDLAVPMLLVSLADRYTYLTPEERGTKQDLHERSTKELLRWHYQKEAERPAPKPKLINGHILIERLGLEPGPLIGEMLRDLEEDIGVGEVSSTEEAVEAARRWLDRRKSRASGGEPEP